jgi:eukaryotic-like serine/threonine-protein kinase
MSPMQRRILGDRYMLVEILGGGGMAEVYLAHDEILERDVALKVLRERYADDEQFVERFRREAKNAASLNHPNIVQVYDQGRSESGTYYMAMEYVPGGTLKERIKGEGPLNPGEAAGIASRVAEALAVAHERGIVHRDIKPQNVLLTASGSEAKVADFGIARAVSSRTMTETNLVLGTAAYMSPEQVRGERVGPASDLYSLGVVLYEVLTGELPYTADDPIATAMKHLDEPPRHPREVNPAVPEALDALTAKLLAKRAEDRYAEAAEVAEDLRRVRDELPPLAAGPGAQSTAQISQDTGKTRTQPSVVAPGRGSNPPASRGRRRTPLPLLALLLGVALLGGLAWTLLRGPSGQDTPGAGGAQRVDVPKVVGLPLGAAEQRLDEARLVVGSRDGAASEEFVEGAVMAQDPAAGTDVERGTAVDVVVSTGLAQEPTTSASPSASPTASPATPTATASASPAGGEAAEESAKEAEKRREEAQKRAEERREEAQKRVEERRKEQEKRGKD